MNKYKKFNFFNRRQFISYILSVLALTSVSKISLASNPDVLEAAAFAVPCSHYGEKIEAGVVLKNKLLLKSGDLILHCRKYLGDFKAPSKIHFLDELPKGPSGKIQRFKIKDLI